MPGIKDLADVLNAANGESSEKTYESLSGRAQKLNMYDLVQDLMKYAPAVAENIMAHRREVIKDEPFFFRSVEGHFRILYTPNKVLIYHKDRLLAQHTDRTVPSGYDFLSDKVHEEFKRLQEQEYSA